MPINQSILFEARKAASGGALSQGIQQGAQLGNLIQQQSFKRDTNMVGNLSAIFGNKNLPVSMRTKALNQYIDFSNDRFNSKFSHVTEDDFNSNNATFSKLSTKLLGLKKQFEEKILNAREVRAAASGLNLEFAQSFEEAEKGGKLVDAFTKPFRRKKPEIEQSPPFTLGDTRFTGTGEPIATAPPKDPSTFEKRKQAFKEEKLTEDIRQFNRSSKLRKRELERLEGSLLQEDADKPVSRQTITEYVDNIKQAFSDDGTSAGVITEKNKTSAWLRFAQIALGLSEESQVSLANELTSAIGASPIDLSSVFPQTFPGEVGKAPTGPRRSKKRATEADIKFTAEQNNMTVQQVRDKLRTQ